VEKSVIGCRNSPPQAGLSRARSLAQGQMDGLFQ
jgi:hypothetical protein